MTDWIQLPITIQDITPAAWPLAVIILVFLLRNEISKLVSKSNVSVKTKAFELVFEQVDTSGLSPNQLTELKNLSAHDIWALSYFEDGDKKERTKDGMNKATRVATVVFIEMGLVKKSGDQYELTNVGKEILDKASNLLK